MDKKYFGIMLILNYNKSLLSFSFPGIVRVVALEAFFGHIALGNLIY